MGMDRGASPPQGVGGIPGLGASETPVSMWRRGVFLVIVAGMLAVPVALMLRPQSVSPTAVPARGPSLTPPALPETPSRPPTDERVDALVAQGLDRARQGAVSDAALLFKKALELRPGDPETWNNLGVVLVRQGQTARGIDAFGRALRLDPTHREASRNLAVTLDGQGRSGEAVVHYRAFLRLAREDHPARDAVRRRLAEISASNEEQ